METYHKIQTLFKRHLDGPKKGKMIPGAWTTPELEFLAGNEWDFTEKVDGTNIRIHLSLPGTRLNVEYGGRTDNAVIPPPLLRSLEATFPIDPAWRSELHKPAYRERNSEIVDWMYNAGLEEVTLFGEGYGPKIQGGGKYVESIINANRGMDPLDPSRMPEHKFVLFDVKIGNFWLNRGNVDDVANKLGIDSVPVIGHGTLQDAIDIVSTGLTWNRLGKMTNWGGVESVAGKDVHRFAGLKSQWGKFEAEGIVARPPVTLFDNQGKRIITKVKAVDFK